MIYLFILFLRVPPNISCTLGNKRFRDIVGLHRADYVRAPKVQKPSVARVIVRAIRNGDPPGRFLKKDDKTGKWKDIGDKKAAEKTSQALREKTDEDKQAAAAAAKFNSPTLVLPKAEANGEADKAREKAPDDTSEAKNSKKSSGDIDSKKDGKVKEESGDKGKVDVQSVEV